MRRAPRLTAAGLGSLGRDALARPARVLTGSRTKRVHRDGGWPEPLPLDTAVMAVEPLERAAVESAPVEDPLRQWADDGALFGGTA